MSNTRTNTTLSRLAIACIKTRESFISDQLLFKSGGCIAPIYSRIGAHPA
jgi:hypothetical protein